MHFKAILLHVPFLPTLVTGFLVGFFFWLFFLLDQKRMFILSDVWGMFMTTDWVLKPEYGAYPFFSCFHLCSGL